MSKEKLIRSNGSARFKTVEELQAKLKELWIAIGNEKNIKQELYELSIDDYLIENISSEEKQEKSNSYNFESFGISHEHDKDEKLPKLVN